MIEWLTELYIRLILNLRILLDNPTGNETVVWLRFFSLFLLAVVMLRFVLDQLAVRCLHRRSSYCDDPFLLRLANEAAAKFRLRKAPEVFFTELIWPLAFSHGIVRPAIFLAPTLRNRLSDEELEAVVTHETAHFGRCDSLRYWLRELLWVLLPILLIQSVAVRFVFNADASRLAWWGGVVLVLGTRLLFKPWDRLREKSCDDDTIAVTRDPLSLARALLRVNRLGQEAAVRSRGLQPVSGYALVAGRSSLRGRVERLVNYRRPRFRQSMRRLGRIALPAVAAGLLLFSVNFHTSQQYQLLIGSVWAAPCPSVLLVD